MYEKAISKIKSLAMWMLFFVQPYGATLPEEKSERNIPLWVAIVVLLVCTLTAVAIIVGGLTWLTSK